MLAAIALAWSTLGPRASAQTVSNEYRLKAAFIYQFPQFVDWPAAAWHDAKRVQFCVAYPSPFGSELERLLKDESLGGRRLALREILTADSVGACHLIFIGSRAADGVDILQAAYGRPILTIGETDRFLDHGGIITLRIVEQRVRFDVSAANAQRGGLRVSSQLLGLASSVRGGPR